MTLSDERRQQVLTYLKQQAQKGIAEMKALVQEEWDRLSGLIEGLSQAQADFRPGPDEWSIAEVVRHLTLSTQRMRDRIAALSQGQPFDQPTRPGALPPDEGLPFAAVVERLRQTAAATVAVLDGCDPAANLEVTVLHSFFGPLNWREWFVFLRVHGRDHSQQVAAIKSSPGFPTA